MNEAKPELNTSIQLWPRVAGASSREVASAVNIPLHQDGSKVSADEARG